VRRDVGDFVETVRRRLRSEAARIGRPALVVAAFDTELFGHWWHEGPAWLARVLRALPAAGIEVGTLAQAAERGFVGAPAPLGDSSWGSGKDWRVWAGSDVADLVRLTREVGQTAIDAVGKRLRAGGEPGFGPTRDPVADQILREGLLCLSSDWAFMVSKHSAEQYARERAHTHAHACREIAAAAAEGREEQARRLAVAWNRADSPFGQLDARLLPLDWS
jgi:1,4-alpha-glucan branching enzyme